MKVLFTALVSLVGIVLAAQPVLNQSFIIAPSDRVIMGQAYINLAPNVVPGGTGPSQVWNFTSTQFDAYDTLNVSNPNWIPNQYVSAFPQSNIAMNHGSSMQSFDLCTSTPTAFYMNGTAGWDPTYGVQSMVYSDPLKYMQWPTTYGTNYIDTAYCNFKFATTGPQDSIWQIITMVVTTTADAWGMLNYSFGGNNVLRLKRDIAYTVLYASHDTISGWGPFTTSSFPIRIYEYWSDDSGATWPIASLTCDPVTDTVQNYWLTTYYTTDVDREIPTATFSLFPNPANSHVTISGEGNSTWEIYDGAGRRVKTGVLQNETMEINVEDLAHGIYVMSVTDEHGIRSTRKFVVQ